MLKIGHRSADAPGGVPATRSFDAYWTLAGSPAPEFAQESDTRQTQIHHEAVWSDGVREDKGNVKSGDVFVYAGPDSERIGKILQDLVDIRVYSGRQLTNLVNKANKGGAN